jgi:hypothetical protein
MRALRLLCLAAALAALVPQASGQYFRFGRNRVPLLKGSWQFLQTPRFDVYFPPGLDALAREAARDAEAHYPRLAALTGHRLEHRVPILLYPSIGALAATNAVTLPEDVEGIGGLTERRRNRVIVPFSGDRREFTQVLTHELTHALLNDRLESRALLRSTRVRSMPLWMNEGLAEYAAHGGVDAASERILRAALLGGRLPPVDRLGPGLLYPGGLSFWAFIAVEYGNERIPEIVDAFAVLRDPDAAFQAVTGLGVAELSERWRDALQDVFAPEVAFRDRLPEDGRALDLNGLDRSYVAAPAIAPQGDRVAFVALDGTSFGVFVARLTGTPFIRRVFEARTPVTRLRLTSAGLTWSPDGRRLAVAVSRTRGETVVVLDAATGVPLKTLRPRLDAILALAWHPTDDVLAVEATRNGQGDLFRLDLVSGALDALTHDPAADHAPAWTHDGSSLLFHSDRNSAPAEARQFDLFRLDVATRRTLQLTRTGWDEAFPVPFGDTLLYVATRNGIANLATLRPGQTEGTPLTDLLGGIEGGVTLSRDGERAVVLGFDGDRLRLYLLRAPLGRSPPATPAPTVFSFLRNDLQGPPPPVLAFASEERRARNPFLRSSLMLPSGIPAPPDSALAVLLDSLSALAPDDPPVEPFRYVADTTAGGEIRARPYRLLFSVDGISGTAVYDPLYGVQALAQIQASDLLGDHVFTAASNLLLDLRNSDYVLGYTFRRPRLDAGLQAFHTARLLPQNGQQSQLTRYRYYGVSSTFSYPLDAFQRTEATLTAASVSQTSVFQPAVPTLQRTLLLPSLTYTLDRALEGATTARAGSRAALSVSGSPAGSARFVTVIGDVRAYRSLARGAAVIALRASGAGSFGPRPQRFYAAGVSGWLDPSIEPDAFPITQLEDFAFATPVLPLRGFRLGTRSGSHFGLINAELRLPLIAVVGAPPGPIVPFEGVLFADAGALWGGPEAPPLKLLSNDAGQGRRLDDLLVGAGGGLRTMLLGFPLRLDVAWPFDGQNFGAARLFLSAGYSF